MYLIIKKQTYETLDPAFTIAGNNEDYDKAIEMLKAYEIINDKDNASFTLLEHNDTLVLDKQVA
tara:strand:+ start:699 stop:890 length:192 start_codon:yes stop_codon:yes gene_type:complete